MCKSSAGPYSPILVGTWMFKFDSLASIPPSKAERPTVVRSLSFAQLMALIIFGEFPDAEIATRTSPALAWVWSCWRKIFS